MDKLPEQLSISDAIRLLNEGQAKPFSMCVVIADRVAEMMERDDPQVEQILRFIADCYLYTDCNVLRIAIENCLLYRLGSHIFSSCNHSRLLKMLPGILYDILMRQMLAAGI